MRSWKFKLFVKQWAATDDSGRSVWLCLWHQENQFWKAGRVQGYMTMGLGYAPISFPLQQSYQTGKVFSMCLTRRREIQTYIRFGKDVPTPPGGLRVTKLVFFKDIPYYYVNLLAISVHGQKLLIDPNVFAVRNQGTSGGCPKDNGSSFTFLIRPAFKAVVEFLEMCFMRFPHLVRGARPLGPPFWTLPQMDDAAATSAYVDISLWTCWPCDQPRGLIHKGEGWSAREWSLMFGLHRRRTILESVHQSNYLFIYDLNQKLLKFAPEDCSKNSSFHPCALFLFKIISSFATL